MVHGYHLRASIDIWYLASTQELVVPFRIEPLQITLFKASLMNLFQVSEL